jgi:C4-dicarboxylate-specific signal transduction histidine kinase
MAGKKPTEPQVKAPEPEETAGRGELPRAEDALRLAHAELEQCVADRTAALERANEKLEATNRELTAANEMLQLVEDELRRAQVELEKRVTERTIELATTVETLLEEITERKKAEEALQAETAERLQVMEQLREKDRMLLQQSRQAAMGELLGNIAHQWRQPLNALGLTVQELGLSYESGCFSKAQLDAGIDNVMGILARLSKTIDDFRNFFNPDREKSRFRVQQVAARTVALVEESFKTQQIVLETVVTGDPLIDGYPNEYSQALLNILLNARDACQERGTTEARVTLRLWSEGERTALTITDNAGGIQEENMERIFEPYFTTKAPGKGTGVGLYLAKTIVENNMGGRLTARNTGAGAEFRIEV